MSITKVLQQDLQPILQKIYKHPFLCQLQSGLLEKKRFNFYLEQDNLYLLRYAEALKELSILSTDAEAATFLYDCALACKQEPAACILTNNSQSSPFITQACHDYTYFIQSNISLGYTSGLCAIFPCFYVYYQVAKELYPAKPTHPYLAWFNTYTSESFISQTFKTLELVGQQFEKQNKNTQAHMAGIIKQATILEYRFWDDSYYKA